MGFYASDSVKEYVSQGVISCSPRIQGELIPEILINYCLMLEDEFWEEVAEEPDGWLLAQVSTDSQFDPASLYNIRVEPSVVDVYYDLNRLSNVSDIILDEFAMKGARFSPGRFEQIDAMPFMSTIVGTVLYPPTAHEKMEALLNLKEWLLSVDISEQDVELLLADKLPKGWLSTQEKIKW